jgi:hypothetical protein
VPEDMVEEAVGIFTRKIPETVVAEKYPFQNIILGLQRRISRHSVINF